MNYQKFDDACSDILNQAVTSTGIGTLSEKTIHAVLKQYFAPDLCCQEQRVHNYVADIVIDNSIIEIQTRNFNTLRRKLDVFLTTHEVTIVYPVAHKKWLCWVNEETGEVSKPRKSPKIGTPYQIFPELYRINQYLSHPNLHLHIVLVDVEEYRLLNGWSKDKKKGSTRNDGIPVGLADEIIIRSREDYKILLPDTLPKQFTTKDYKRAAGLSKGNATTALHVLHYLEVIERVGKIGNLYLYEITK